MKYYCVTSSYYNNGKVTAAITDVTESDIPPENTWKKTHTRDIYNEWFDSAEEAAEYMKQCKEA